MAALGPAGTQDGSTGHKWHCQHCSEGGRTLRGTRVTDPVIGPTRTRDSPAAQSRVPWWPQTLDSGTGTDLVFPESGMSLVPSPGKLRNVTCATLNSSDLDSVSVGKSIPNQKFLDASWFFVDSDWGF